MLEIGVGTGIKLSALDLRAIEEAVAVEISPGVIEGSRWFANYNHNITARGAKVRVVCADGRNFVAITPRKFNVIVNGLLTPAAYKGPRQFNWVVSMVLFVLTLALSFTGYLLPR